MGFDGLLVLQHRIEGVVFEHVVVAPKCRMTSGVFQKAVLRECFYMEFSILGFMLKSPGEGNYHMKSGMLGLDPEKQLAGCE